MKILAAILFLALAGSGCVTKSQADAQARAAFLAGQRMALAKMSGAQNPGVTIIGPVRNPNVPWVDGLTLAQAIATATYTGFHNPREIILTRQGKKTSINPDDLLNGRDTPLEPGDTVTIHE
ncbi:MAG: hypothetical protein ACREFE_15020 [Limisphaerales bacterium]